MRSITFFFLSVSVMLAAGCTHNGVPEQEVKEIIRQRDSLLEASAQKDSSINSFLISFNEIERNLDNIRALQENVALRWSGGSEIKKDIQEEVMEDIRVINELMEQNQKKISSLSSIIRSNDNKIQELNGMVNTLIQHIEDKNHELAILNTSLMEKNKELAQRNKVIFRIPQ